MNVRISAGVVLLGVLLATASGSVVAQNDMAPSHQVCRQVRVQDKPKDNHQIAGTLVGAAAGGLIGSKFGGGSGKTLTTVGGVAAGGYAGKKIQENHQDNNTTYHYEQRCYESQG